VLGTYGCDKETMSGLDNLKKRVEYMGGDQNGRLAKAKLQSFKSALSSSYQSAQIIKLTNGEEYSALINPDRVKPDYDNKFLSVENNAGFQVGDILHWPATNTYWIIYLQELTEDAYLRAAIRRCRYKLLIGDNEYYVYIQGPTETDTKWNQKAGVSWNKLNYSLTMFVARTPESLLHFQRSNTVTLDGRNWKIEASDSISIPGLIEVNLGEDFNNEMAASEFVPEILPLDDGVLHIKGDLFVAPFSTHTYTAWNPMGDQPEGVWTIMNGSTKAKILTQTYQSVTIEVVSGKRGSFELEYTIADAVVTSLITIESL
jgi:hypothetical protein